MGKRALIILTLLAGGFPAIVYAQGNGNLPATIPGQGKEKPAAKEIPAPAPTAAATPALGSAEAELARIQALPANAEWPEMLNLPREASIAQIMERQTEIGDLLRGRLGRVEMAPISDRIHASMENLRQREISRIRSLGSQPAWSAVLNIPQTSSDEEMKRSWRGLAGLIGGTGTDVARNNPSVEALALVNAARTAATRAQKASPQPANRHAPVADVREHINQRISDYLASDYGREQWYGDKFSRATAYEEVFDHFRYVGSAKDYFTAVEALVERAGTELHREALGHALDGDKISLFENSTNKLEDMLRLGHISPEVFFDRKRMVIVHPTYDYLFNQAWKDAGEEQQREILRKGPRGSKVAADYLAPLAAYSFQHAPDPEKSAGLLLRGLEMETAASYAAAIARGDSEPAQLKAIVAFLEEAETPPAVRLSFLREFLGARSDKLATAPLLKDPQILESLGRVAASAGLDANERKVWEFLAARDFGAAEIRGSYPIVDNFYPIAYFLENSRDSTLLRERMETILRAYADRIESEPKFAKDLAFHLGNALVDFSTRGAGRYGERGANFAISRLLKGALAAKADPKHADSVVHAAKDIVTELRDVNLMIEAVASTPSLLTSLPEKQAEELKHFLAMRIGLDIGNAKSPGEISAQELTRKLPWLTEKAKLKEFLRAIDDGARYSDRRKELLDLRARLQSEFKQLPAAATATPAAKPGSGICAVVAEKFGRLARWRKPSQ